MQTLGQAYEAALEAVKQIGGEPAALEARLLVAHASNVSPERVFGFPETALSEGQRRSVADCLSRRRAREPLFQIVGEREFWGRPFKISRDVLSPRPDSETLVSSVLDWVNREGRDRPLRLIEFGSGSGCLLLALLSELDEAHGVGVEISRKACEIAAINAKRLGLAERADFAHSAWQDWRDHAPIAADIVISNPPYIPSGDIAALEPEVRLYEPHSALDGGEDGLDAYRTLVPKAKALLKPDGVVFFEVGAAQAEAVAGLLSNAGFTEVRVTKDLAGMERCVSAIAAAKEQANQVF